MVQVLDVQKTEKISSVMLIVKRQTTNVKFSRFTIHVSRLDAAKYS